MGAAEKTNLSESARMRVISKEDAARVLRELEVEPEVRTPRVILVDEETGKERAVLVATRDGVFAEITRFGQRLLCPILFGEPVAVREDDGS